MRIIVTGDRFWSCRQLAVDVLRRLQARYGEIRIVHGDASGVDESFADACKGLGVPVEVHPAEPSFGEQADSLRNMEMVAAGAELCLAFHRSITTSKGTKDCARQAILAGIPTYLIDSEEEIPKRLKLGDPRLA